MHDTCLITSIGLEVPLTDPRPHDIALKDIAHHLALINRYGGATRLPLSVAQHSLLVASLCESCGARLALLGLMHDAHEAYLHDIATPQQRAYWPGGGLTRRRDLEDLFDDAIYRRFGIAAPSGSERQAVAVMDEVAFATEWRDLMPEGVPCPKAATPADFRICAMPWAEAEAEFVRRFERLILEVK